MNDNELAQTVENFQAHLLLNDDETTALNECRFAASVDLMI